MHGMATLLADNVVLWNEHHGSIIHYRENVTITCFHIQVKVK